MDLSIRLQGNKEIILWWKLPLVIKGRGRKKLPLPLSFISDKKYGALSVDNTPGFAIGDTNIGNIHYAIKSESASLLGYATLYRQAKQLCDDLISAKTITTKELENAFKVFVNGKNTPVKQAVRIAGEELAMANGDYKKIAIPTKNKNKKKSK